MQLISVLKDFFLNSSPGLFERVLMQWTADRETFKRQWARCSKGSVKALVNRKEGFAAAVSPVCLK